MCQREANSYRFDKKTLEIPNLNSTVYNLTLIDTVFALLNCLNIAVATILFY